MTCQQGRGVKISFNHQKPQQKIHIFFTTEESLFLNVDIFVRFTMTYDTINKTWNEK